MTSDGRIPRRVHAAPRFTARADLRALPTGTLYLEPTPEVEQRLQDVLSCLWAGEIKCADEEGVLAALKELLQRMFAPGLSPEQRMRIGEQSSKVVCVHSRIDEETFDTDRIRQCCVGIREPGGRTFPRALTTSCTAIATRVSRPCHCRPWPHSAAAGCERRARAVERQAQGVEAVSRQTPASWTTNWSL